MGSTALRQLLASFCSNSVWHYAVLWKLRPATPVILTWEDGYFDYPKPTNVEGPISNNARCFSPLFETNASSGYPEEDPVGLVVPDMLRLQYVFGEGVVGEVAAIGDHLWASFNNIFSRESKSIPECPEEWLLQFVSGIKTILLVPVLPHGVLQFGSLKEIAEDINVVTYVKGRFNSLDNIEENTILSSLKKEFQTQLSPPLSSTSIEYLNVPSISAFVSVKTEDLDHLGAANFAELDDANLATDTLVVQPLLTVQDALMPAGDLLEAFISQRESKNDVFLGEISSPSASMSVRQPDLMESKMFELSCLMEELQAYSEEPQGYSGCSGYTVGVLGESLNGTTNAYPAGNIAEEPFEGYFAVHAGNESAGSLLEFPKDSELHKALEPVFKEPIKGKLWDSSLLAENICSAWSLSSNKDPSMRNDLSWLGRGGDAEYLLEAVVANACSTDDPTLNKSSSFKSCTSFSGQTSASPLPKKENEASAWLSDNSISQGHLTSVCVTKDKDADSDSDALKTMMSAICSKEHKEIGSVNADQRKGHKTLNSNKRGARTGDSKRPRPRDRQLIQDRVKELRELVPNAAKCSIDSLLDKTIKHMTYLRSVTSQAEKLRQCVHQELAGCKSWRPLKIKEADRQNGTSWALEYGNEFLACPIAVEDLAHPGHMLIEMLCNEHGLFLEIAQVIRGLEMTILKGILESRAKNTWARFVVEAPKGFHRLDIFWPLMQLLQRKRKSIASKI